MQNGAYRQFLQNDVGIRPRQRCLDAGCGVGHALLDMASIVGPHGFAVGVDLEWEPLQEADSHTWAVSRVALCQADAAQLPFSTGVFDVVFASLLLLWVHNPVSILAEFKRVTRRGGRVALVDVDLSTLRFEPAPAFWDHFTAALRGYQRRHGNDGEIGRKLYRMCHDAGLTNLRVQASVSIVTPEQPNWKAATSLVTGPLARAIVDDGGLEAELLAQLERDIAILAEEPGTIFVAGVTYAVVGTVAQAVDECTKPGG
jgi:SAM-dependent methyltransferase